GSGSVVDGTGVGGCDGAVLLEDGPQIPQLLEVDLSWTFVDGDGRYRALPADHVDRDDLGSERAVGLSTLRPAVGVFCELVLLRAAEAVFGGAQLGARAHVFVVVNVPQPVVHQRVN